VLTGLVQEPEFGMSRSACSRLAGGIVGAPLAMAGLAGGIVGAPLAMAGLAALFPGPTFPGRWLRGSGSGSGPAIPGRRRC
jgi:cytochrome bd-type quinol oxidase subunit 1